jgi:hypothetical protein
MPHDITVVVATTTAPDSAVISIEVREGDEHDRADVVAMVLAHLDSLCAELADRIKAVERQDTTHRGLRA